MRIDDGHEPAGCHGEELSGFAESFGRFLRMTCRTHAAGSLK